MISVRRLSAAQDLRLGIAMPDVGGDRAWSLL